MRRIDKRDWPRREHFEVFSTWDYAHFNMCAQVDLSKFYPYLKQHNISFNIATVYMISRTANAIPEFRYRIRDGDVVEHDMVHPASTILIDDELFSFCIFNYLDEFSAFNASAAERIAHFKEQPTLEDEPGRDDYLFMTAIPWVSFTSFMHPLDFPVDSVPRFAWGKFFKEGESLKMPLSVQGHHALMDGVHMGRFYKLIQEYLDQPELILAGSTEKRNA